MSNRIIDELLTAAVDRLVDEASDRLLPVHAGAGSATAPAASDEDVRPFGSATHRSGSGRGGRLLAGDQLGDACLVGLGAGEGDELLFGVVGDLESDVVQLQLAEPPGWWRAGARSLREVGLVGVAGGGGAEAGQQRGRLGLPLGEHGASGWVNVHRTMLRSSAGTRGRRAPPTTRP